jgi:hypothetical protein
MLQTSYVKFHIEAHTDTKHIYANILCNTLLVPTVEQLEANEARTSSRSCLGACNLQRKGLEGTHAYQSFSTHQPANVEVSEVFFGMQNSRERTHPFEDSYTDSALVSVAARKLSVGK